MKRGGTEVAPAHLERVRRTLQWGGSRRCQALGQGGRALPCLVKMFQHQRHSVLLAAVLSRPLGAAHAAMLRGASLWAAECGTHVIWPCGGVRPREMRVEGRRRRRRRWKRPMPINKCSCCCVVLEATIDRILKKSARPPLSTTP